MEHSVVIEIIPILLPMPFKLGSVNCYLLNTEGGYFLLDTSSSNNRAELERELKRAGCVPGKLKLILLTHGDFDHTGNAAYLRKKFDSKIAMHIDDLGMVKDGDMFSSRQKGNNIFTRKLVPLLIGFGKAERFKPDFYLDEGDELSQYGLEAKVLSIPGHSLGSIGILTNSGDLFCGDLFESTKEPALNSLMDDLAAANNSLEKLKSFEINTVYPGHGSPFQMEQFLSNSP
jgi:glyoxylase-like metal-dependent hydrolase (beta-lactamase superfamily II)